MTNTSKNTENTNKNDLNDNVDIKNQVEDKTNSQFKVAGNLPVLAKDEFYLSKLERELKRGSSSRNSSSNKKSNTDAKHDAKNSDDLEKKQAQFGKLKTRSQQAVQARMDSIPENLAAKLNLDLPVSQRAEDLVQVGS